MMREFATACRHPGGWLREICGGEAAFPLVVLFGLNAVDELDRTAFGILLPNIRDEFHLDNTKALGLLALVSQWPRSPCRCRSPSTPTARAGCRWPSPAPSRGRSSAGSPAWPPV